MPTRAPKLSIEPQPDRCYIVNDHDSTVALVSSQGLVDWLQRRPGADGPRLDAIRKEPHLSYVLGLKLELCTPTPHTTLRELKWAIGPDAASLTLIAEGESADGDWQSSTRATLRVCAATGEWEWALHTELTCIAHDPVELKWLEYNNIYPSLTGCCFLYAPRKRYHHTLMLDAAGQVWDFPHQHRMHYTRKIQDLSFAPGTWCGFFGEQDGSPVCVVQRSSLPPDWGICDMYYDLHCGARPQAPVAPGTSLHFDYTLRYFTPAESRAAVAAARPIPVTKEDKFRHATPRLELGLNHFDEAVAIDRFDDASGFNPKPPEKVWDREVGASRRGALRLTQAQAEELVWTATPPTQIPPETELTLSALVKTAGCSGRGIFLRVKYHTFHWHPTPHVEWAETLESNAVSGTSDGWTFVQVPLLRVPPEHFDYLVLIQVVLDGPGTAWLTDCDVDLAYVDAPVPVAT